MQSETKSKFEQWAIVEVMGHKRYAGFVTETEIAGHGFVKIDVPAVDTQEGQLPAFTKYQGPSSIYGLTPCTEETARAFSKSLQTRAFHIYEAPRLTAPAMETETFERYESEDADLDDR